jgi:hypothetical protein
MPCKLQSRFGDPCPEIQVPYHDPLIVVVLVISGNRTGHDHGPHAEMIGQRIGYARTRSASDTLESVDFLSEISLVIHYSSEQFYAEVLRIGTCSVKHKEYRKNVSHRKKLCKYNNQRSSESQQKLKMGRC